MLGCGAQPELTHRVDNAPLDRLQSIAQVREGAVEDHVHGVIQVGFFGVVLEWNLFVIRKRLGDFGHGLASTRCLSSMGMNITENKLKEMIHIIPEIVIQSS